MQRGSPNVWTAHNSRGCFGAKKLIIKHNGKIIAETVFDPKAKQPRAYFTTQASVKYRGGSAIIEV